MIEILLAATITRLEPGSSKTNLPPVSRFEARRLAAGAAALLFLIFMAATGADTARSFRDNAEIALISDAARHPPVTADGKP